LFGLADLLVLDQARKAVGDGSGRAATKTLCDGGHGQRAVVTVLTKVCENEAVKLAGTQAPLCAAHCSEQDRLASETGQAERHLETAEASFGDIAETLAKVLDLLADCRRAYLAAPGHLRRQWNQALFERLVVYDERITDAEVSEPFATLADPELPKRLDGEAVTGTGASSGGGSNEELLIGETGFEPATARPPAECATRLRHSPWLSAF
jgi:hypothetical protein